MEVTDFFMDMYEVTNDEVMNVFQWAYDNGKLIVSGSSVKNAEGSQYELMDLEFACCRITWNGSAFQYEELQGKRLSMCRNSCMEQ